MNTAQPETIKIMIIDDCREDRKIFIDYLSNHLDHIKFEFVEKETIEDAFEVSMSDKTDPIDCILLDHNFPAAKGTDFISRLYQNKNNQHIPVVMLTGEANINVAVAAMKKGAMDYIVKNSLNPEYLSTVILNAIGKMSLKKKLDNQTEQLRRLNNLKDNYVAMLAHDLKNPLTYIRESMRLTLTKKLLKENQDKAGHLISRALAQTDFCLNLIVTLLDIERIEKGMKLSKSHCKVEDLINISLEGVEYLADKKRIILEKEMEGNYELDADFNKLLQVITNLLTNAIKFTPENGKVSVKVDDLLDENEQKQIRIAITDTGRGIAEDKLDRIFDKYEQVKDTDLDIGTGLGLAISKEICRLHEGKIWVESTENLGSTFFVTIPLTS